MHVCRVLPSSVLDGPLRQILENFPSLAFLFPSLNRVLTCSCPFEPLTQNWATLWHNNIKNIAKCSCIFYTAAADKAHKMLCYYVPQGKRLPVVCWLLPSYRESSFLTHGCSLQGADTLMSPHRFPPSPYAQPFVPVPASSLRLYLCDCMPGSGLNPITEMIKAERNFISEGYFYSLWLQWYSQQHSTIVQVSGSAWQRKQLWPDRNLSGGFALQKIKLCGSGPAWQGSVKGASV